MTTQELDSRYVWADRAARALFGLIACSFAIGVWVTKLQVQVNDQADQIAQMRAKDKQDSIDFAALKEIVIENRTDTKWIRERLGGDKK